jgi:hypothetical protein
VHARIIVRKLLVLHASRAENGAKSFLISAEKRKHNGNIEMEFCGTRIKTVFFCRNGNENGRTFSAEQMQKFRCWLIWILHFTVDVHGPIQHANYMTL